MSRPLILAVLTAVMSLAAPAADRPNFIIIYVDDLGYADIGPFGSKLHRTPHLDAMAEQGRKFTSFYVSANVCTPSRASLMTGSYPRRVGLDVTEDGRWVLFPGNQEGLNADETTIAEVLKAAGYRTALVGKWHLGDQPEFLPTRHGFDSYFGIPYSNDMGHDSRPEPYRYPPLPLLRGETVIESEPDQRLITQRYTQEALEFIRRSAGEPFFLYLAHTMPHWPQYASQEFAGKSKNGPWGDAVEEIDWSTGKIFEELERLGIDEKTLVVFTSDNGGAVRHGASNEPLRGGKGSTWEGGHRVAMVARWPGRIPAGTTTDEIAMTMDLLPTFAALGEAHRSTDRRIDGQDIGPLLLEEDPPTTPHLAYFYYYMDSLDAVRSGRWKLFVGRSTRRQGERIQDEVTELYDLEADIGESRNVAKEHPAIVAQLRSLIETARSDLGEGADVGKGVRAAGLVERARTLTSN